MTFFDGDDAFTDPDREAGHRPQPSGRQQPRKPGDRVTARILAQLPPRGRQIMREELAKPVPRSVCHWQGCTQPGAELHHYLERAIFGELAERGPIALLCKKHHDLITDVRMAHDRANRQPPHSSACQCDGRGWIEVEDTVIGDWVCAPCPGPVRQP